MGVVCLHLMNVFDYFVVGLVYFTGHHSGIIRFSTS
jgi:hypothetical protein